MPFSRGLGKEVLYICITGAIALLIFYFSPYGFGKIGYLNLLGFGLVSVLAGILYIISTHYLYENYRDNRQWTVGWEIIHSLCFLLFIAISILVYGYFLRLTDLNFKNFFLYLFYTILFGLIPVTIRAVLVGNWRLKKELAEAKKINELITGRKLASDEKIIELQDTSSKSTLKLSTHDLLYVEAAENYITVVWEQGPAIKKEMLRMTMKAASKQINDPLIVFCHRSFIVNLRKVQTISSCSGVFSIRLNGVETAIPLSGTYKKEIKQKLVGL
jgi:ABC-type multidrug transport system fused ATPase/permease subunit